MSVAGYRLQLRGLQEREVVPGVRNPFKVDIPRGSIVDPRFGNPYGRNPVIHADWDLNAYEKGIRVSKDEMTKARLKPADFHGEWNYTIVPRSIGRQI